MTRFEEIYVNEAGEKVSRVIVEGEESERQQFLNEGRTLPENSKWFVPDTNQTYYWSKSQNTLKPFGWNSGNA